MIEHLIRTLGFFMVIIFPSICQANSVLELSLEKRVARSDLVVIAKATAIGFDGFNHGNRSKYAKFHVIQALKGGPASDINVEYISAIREADPVCCTVGKIYLLFLQKVNDSLYVSVNYRFGVFEIHTMDGDLK